MTERPIDIRKSEHQGQPDNAGTCPVCHGRFYLLDSGYLPVHEVAVWDGDQRSLLADEVVDDEAAGGHAEVCPQRLAIHIVWTTP